MTTCDLDPRLGLGANPFPLPLHFEVCAVGEAVRTVRPGYRVAVPFQISCANSRHAQPLDRHTAIYGAADLDVRVWWVFGFKHGRVEFCVTGVRRRRA